ncbi:MAG: TIM barrel protein [Caldilineaceae bacterium]|nr:TIM barrel protein [Caldilineaceae bacterium]
MTTISIGNAPCSWGTLEFKGAQSGRIEADQMLDELTAAGYTGSELGDWGFMPTEPDPLAEHYRQRGLAITGAYVGVKLRDLQAHTAGEETAVRTAKLLAATADRLGQSVRPFLVLADDAGTDPIRVKHAGRVKPEMMLGAEEWKRYAAGAERIARAVKAQSGLRTVFHHHCAGFVETPEEIALLLDHTDPEILGLVFDTGHFAYGAGSCDRILSALNRFAERIWYVHFKDYDPQVGNRAAEKGWDYFEAVRQGVFCELGSGCVDFPAVRDWLQQHSYCGFVTVEQDVLPGMGQPKESAKRNRDYLRSIGL